MHTASSFINPPAYALSLGELLSKILWLEKSPLAEQKVFRYKVCSPNPRLVPPNDLTDLPIFQIEKKSLQTERAARQETDAMLVALSAQGDTAAFAALYDRLSGPLLAMILRMLNDRAEAEDVLQEIFLKIWKKAESYDPRQSSVFSWSVLIARGTTIDQLRRKTRRARIISSETPVETAPMAVAPVDNSEANRDMQRCLEQLADAEREVIDLAFFSGLTHEEIADQLTQPLGTVKARIRRGLLKLRTYFSQNP